MRAQTCSGDHERRRRPLGLGLFIAGSCVFPISGAANPVLTIAALAVRVADKMKTKLGFAGWSASDEISADGPLWAAVYAESR
jgi:choline dehydrogenase-like flavoprotein